MASSQFPPAIPPKLPPSTETAYHGKCIDLKRRIAEIEEENEKTILRKTRHTEGLQRNRLNRAILLKWLDDMMNGGPKPTTEQLAAMQNTIQTEGTTVATDMNGMARPYHLDDETEATDEDNVPRPPPDRPLRSKRSHNPVSSSAPAASAPQSNVAAGGSSLPHLLPANSQSHSPAPAQDQMTSSFRVHIPTLAPTGSPPPAPSPTQPYAYHNTPQPSTAPPARPSPPFEIFYQEQQNAQQTDIPEDTTRTMWTNLNPDQQAHYHQVYEERMKIYETEMDEYKRTKRDGGLKAVNAQDGIKLEG